MYSKKPNQCFQLTVKSVTNFAIANFLPLFTSTEAGVRTHSITMASEEQQIQIEWNYTPPGYFENPVLLERDNYSIEIASGSIVARMTSTFFDSREDVRDSLTRELKDYFLGAQAIRRQPFELQGGAIVRICPDGRRDTTIVIQSAVMKMTAGNLDLAYTDPDGVFHDTRRERIDATNDLGKLAARYAVSDNTAQKILDSFDASVRDPDNELVHLYEVCKVDPIV